MQVAGESGIPVPYPGEHVKIQCTEEPEGFWVGIALEVIPKADADSEDRVRCLVCCINTCSTIVVSCLMLCGRVCCAQWMRRVGRPYSGVYRLTEVASSVGLSSVLAAGTFLGIRATATGADYVILEDDIVQAAMLENHALYSEMSDHRTSMDSLNGDLAVRVTLPSPAPVVPLLPRHAMIPSPILYRDVTNGWQQCIRSRMLRWWTMQDATCNLPSAQWLGNVKESFNRASSFDLVSVRTSAPSSPALARCLFVSRG